MSQYPADDEYIRYTLILVDDFAIRSSDNDSTGFWLPGSLHTLGADGHT